MAISLADVVNFKVEISKDWKYLSFDDKFSGWAIADCEDFECFSCLDSSFYLSLIYASSSFFFFASSFFAFNYAFFSYHNHFLHPYFILTFPQHQFAYSPLFSPWYQMYRFLSPFIINVKYSDYPKSVLIW